MSGLEAQAQGRPFNKEDKQDIRSRTPAADRKYLVDVGARVFAPGLHKPVTFRGNRAVVYLQFQQPLTAAERGRLTRLEVRFYEAISPNTYTAKIHENALPSLTRHPLIRGIELVQPEDKLTENLFQAAVGRHVVNRDGTWSVFVRYHADVKLPQALTTLDTLGIRATDRSRLLFNNRLLVHASRPQIMALAADPAVSSIEEIPPPGKTDNLVAAQLSNVDDVRAAPYNLDGTGVILGIWDGGPVRIAHPDLTPRVTLIENNGPIDDHATHVAGTMISSGANNANAIGMAPNATLFSWDFDNGVDEATEQADGVNNQAIVIANHSWGPRLGWNSTTMNDDGNTGLFGSYDGTARDWDTLVRNTGLIVCKSSGNDRNDCNPGNPADCDGVLGADGQRYDTIGTQGNSKNVITVGAINDDGTTIAGFSSSGPADDGRIKPDVVANGVGLLSTWGLDLTLGGCPGQDYCSIGGTSMSTPTVSGLCALLVERYRQVYSAANPSPDIIKALLVNTATDLGRPGPDYLFGHGLVNALAAVQTIDAGPVRIITSTVDHGDVDEYLIALPAGLPALRATLNWVDPAGAANSGANDIINNLDLEVVGPDNVVRFPFTGTGVNFIQNATATGANNIDTVEQATVNAPQQGFWRVRVRGTGVPSGPQNYALVANVSFSLPNQPDLRLNAPLDFDEVCPGEQQLRTVSIFNIGGADLLVSSVAVIAGGADFSVLPNPTQPFIIQPGGHIDLQVRFAPTSPGPKAGTLRIVSNDADQGTLDLPMTGNGGTRALAAFIADSGLFGDVCLGSFRDLNLTLNNTGGCPLIVSNITSSSGQFLVPVVVNYPLVIHPGDSVAIPVRLQPTGAFGPRAGTISILSSDPLSPKVVAVSGNVPPGDLRVTGSADFGQVCAGANHEKTISICNVGKCNLTVSGVAFAPPCADFILVNNPFPAVVSPDSCVSVVIRFTPTGCGPKNCNLRITTDDPDTPVINLSVTANTSCPAIDVPPDLGFAPEVIQSAGACSTPLPFPISNRGECNLVITDISIGGVNAGDFGLSGLPSFPVILQPGHIVGDGDLNVVFAPTALARARTATISVTYVSDPFTGATTTVTRSLCGEGVYTGARVLVMQNGIPVAQVEKIHLQRINANRNKSILDTQDVSSRLPLVTVIPSAPCAPFQYHREYGTVSNPIQLLPGSYQVTASAIINGKRKSLSVGFDVSTCDFNPTIVINF